MARPIFEGSIVKAHPLRIRMLPDRLSDRCLDAHNGDSGCPHSFIVSAVKKIFDKLY